LILTGVTAHSLMNAAINVFDSASLVRRGPGFT
jgi:hypothetical protein